MAKGFKGQIPWNKGKCGIYSVEYRKKLSEAHKAYVYTVEHKKNISDAQKGHTRHGWELTIEQKAYKSAITPKGKEHHRWKGGYENKLMINKNYRIRKKEIEGSHSLGDWQSLKERFNFMCLCCKKFEPEITLSEDHIIPISLGGNNDISNIQPLCRQCNSRKHTKIINYIPEATFAMGIV